MGLALNSVKEEAVAVAMAAVVVVSSETLRRAARDALASFKTDLRTGSRSVNTTAVAHDSLLPPSVAELPPSARPRSAWNVLRLRARDERSRRRVPLHVPD